MRALGKPRRHRPQAESPPNFWQLIIDGPADFQALSSSVFLPPDIVLPWKPDNGSPSVDRETQTPKVLLG